MATGLPATIDELGLERALDIGALAMAQTHRLRVAPTRRMSLAIMARLRDAGLIEVPWPDERWAIAPDAHETPIEGLQWRLLWPAYPMESLATAVIDYLETIELDEYAILVQLRLWQDLALGEAERYFEYQLAKHQFNPQWAQDLLFAFRDTRAELSAAQWRYCVWAATRQGASAALQMGNADSNAVRQAIYSDLVRRVGPVMSGQWPNAAFAPRNPRPESALARLFLDRFTSIGSAFWHVVPTDVALLAPRARQGAEG